MLRPVQTLGLLFKQDHIEMGKESLSVGLFPKEANGNRPRRGWRGADAGRRPQQAPGVRPNHYHSRSCLNTCPFMWGCYVGRPSLLQQRPATPTPLLGRERTSSFTNTDAVSSRSVPGLLGLPTAALGTVESQTRQGPKKPLRPWKPGAEINPQETLLSAFLALFTSTIYVFEKY